MGLTGVGRRIRVVKETPIEPIVLPTPAAEPEPIVAGDEQSTVTVAEDRQKVAVA